MEKKDLDISLAIPNSVVSRKHCGKFELGEIYKSNKVVE